MTEPTPTFDRTDDGLVLATAESRYVFSEKRGLPKAVERRSDGTRYRLRPPESPPIEWTVGGTERRHPPSAEREYRNATTFDGTGLSLVDLSFEPTANGATLLTVAVGDDWRLTNRYAIGGVADGLEWCFDLEYVGEAEDVRLRSVRVPLRVPIENAAETTLDVPGAPMPPDLAMRDLDSSQILEWGRRRYHAGLVGLDDSSGGLACWAFSETFPTSLAVEYDATDPALSLTYQFEAAARLAPGEAVTVSRYCVEAYERGWEAWLGSVGDWWDAIGIRSPDERPSWFRSATIFEAHVGAAQFPADYAYEPYPTVETLIADLPRIASMGFDTLQLMPKHPTPSYTVVPPDADRTPWGDPEELRELVAVAHALDLHVVLDVVMHGVLDTDVLDRTVGSIRASEADPYEDSLKAYVLSHESAWREDLPDTHPLLERHPDWFVRTDEGDIAHRYTHALDLANPAVQEYFVDFLETVVETYDVDGFRIDAPTWNAFPNWADDLPYPAGHATFGAVDLLETARSRLRSTDPETALYVEAAGPLFRKSSDANYSYDELWLFEAIFGADRTRMGRRLDAELDGHDLARWLDRRDRALPEDSLTAHHLDSHDTFWWPDPGEKWFRERYGRERTAALLALVALLPGPFMNYVGGGTAVEHRLERLLDIRDTYAAFESGTCRYGTPDVADPAVFTALRGRGDETALLAVNLSADPRRVTIDADALLDGGYGVVFDPLECDVVARNADADATVAVDFEAFQPRVLVCRERPE